MNEAKGRIALMASLSGFLLVAAVLLPVAAYGQSGGGGGGGGSGGGGSAGGGSAGGASGGWCDMRSQWPNSG